MTPAPEATKRRRLPAILAGVFALVLLLPAGYVAACALTPLPSPEVQLTAQSSVELPPGSEVQRAVEAQTLPSAAGWLDGEAVWANDSAAYPLASITKIVTALVGLEREPLEVGEDGAHYTWTAADVELQDELISQDGVAFPIEEGTDVTHLQMLALALIPSANDFAIAYAHDLFGTDDEFIAAVNDWKHRNGIESLSIEEPSGMSTENRANAADLVRISRLALENPVLATLMQQRTIEVPWGYGTIENSNPLFGLGLELVGLKTGFTDDAGYNLASAAVSETDDRTFTGIAVVLGRETNDERVADSLELLDALASSPRELTVVDAGAEVGTVRAVDGSTATLTARDRVVTVLAPGEVAALTPEIHRDGSVSLAAELPTGFVDIGTSQVGELPPPTLWWRLTHPGLLFG